MAMKREATANCDWPLNTYYALLISRIILLVRLSAYMRLSAVTAHIKAGIQPIMVICKIRQMMPLKIFPCKNSDSHGKKNAITYLMMI